MEKNNIIGKTVLGDSCDRFIWYNILQYIPIYFMVFWTCFVGTQTSNTASTQTTYFKEKQNTKCYSCGYLKNTLCSTVDGRHSTRLGRTNKKFFRFKRHLADFLLRIFIFVYFCCERKFSDSVHGG